MAIIIGKLIPLVIPRIWLMCLLSITYHWNDWQLQYSNNQFIIIFLKRAQYIFNYYSFEKYPRFWVGKTTRIIHHNQPLLTKFGKNFVILNQWRQNDVRSAARWRLLNRWPGDEVVLFLVSKNTKSEMATIFLPSDSWLNNLNARAMQGLTESLERASEHKISIFTHRDSSTNQPRAICSHQREGREDPEKIL